VGREGKGREVWEVQMGLDFFSNLVYFSSYFSVVLNSKMSAKKATSLRAARFVLDLQFHLACQVVTQATVRPHLSGDLLEMEAEEREGLDPANFDGEPHLQVLFPVATLEEELVSRKLHIVDGENPLHLFRYLGGGFA